MAILDQFGNPIKAVIRKPPRSFSPSAAYPDYLYSSPYREQVPYHTADWSSSFARMSRKIAMSYGRYLYLNLGEIKGIINSITRFSIGSGLKPQSRAESPEMAKEYEEIFDEWSKNCDVHSRTSFRNIQKIVSTRVDIDGDIGVAFTKSKYTGECKLQLFESHRIGYEDTDKKKSKNIMDGVEFDSDGEIIQYWVREIKSKDEIGGEKPKYISIPKDYFRLIYDPDRAVQYRGMSSMEHAILDCLDIKELMLHAKIGLKIREGVGMIIYNESGRASVQDDPSYTISSEDVPYYNERLNPNPENEFNFDAIQPGYVPRLKLNEKITDINSNRPGESFHKMVHALYQRVCNGLGIPYEMVFPTQASSPTGPAMRAILTRAQSIFDARADLLENKLCEPVWCWVIQDAIDKKITKETEGWKRVNWRRPPKFSIDVGRDSAASLAELKAGTNTIKGDSTSRGEDWVEIREQREIEAKDLMERGLNLFNQYKGQIPELTVPMCMSLMSDTDAALKDIKDVFGANVDTDTKGPTSVE